MKKRVKKKIKKLERDRNMISRKIEGWMGRWEITCFSHLKKGKRKEMRRRKNENESNNTVPGC